MATFNKFGMVAGSDQIQPGLKKKRQLLDALGGDVTTPALPSPATLPEPVALPQTPSMPTQKATMLAALGGGTGGYSPFGGTGDVTPPNLGGSTSIGADPSPATTEDDDRNAFREWLGETGSRDSRLSPFGYTAGSVEQVGPTQTPATATNPAKPIPTTATSPTAASAVGVTTTAPDPSLPFEGFNFTREQDPAKSAKDAFAMLVSQAPDLPPGEDKAALAAWFQQHIAPGMNALGHTINWVNGDKINYSNWEGTYTIDWLRGAGAPGWGIAWQPQGGTPGTGVYKPPTTTTTGGTPSTGTTGSTTPPPQQTAGGQPGTGGPGTGQEFYSSTGRSNMLAALAPDDPIMQAILTGSGKSRNWLDMIRQQIDQSGMLSNRYF